MALLRYAKSIRYLVVTLAAWAILTGAQAAVITIKFDDVDTTSGPVGGAPVLSYLAGFGITYSSQNDTPFIVSGFHPHYWPASEPNYFAVGSPSSAYSFMFDNPVEWVSFWTISTGSTSTMAAWTAKAYAPDNSLLSSISQGVTGNTPGSLFTLSGPGILRVDFTDNAGSAGLKFGFDDLKFEVTVPEPLTLALMGIGLAGLGFARRKK